MKKITMKTRQLISKTLFIIILDCCSIVSFGQDPTDSLPDDPGAISVYTIQNMSFGAFSHGNSGGTVTISNSGVRSVTGDLILLNMGVSYFNSIFEIDAPAGSVISILNGSDVSLTGSNGGSINLHIGNSNPSSPFVTVVPQPARTPVNFGGTITVGNAAANPPGTYTGTFYVTFNLE
ncbi:MAG: DUF4402 domain-containing protein [Ferruginibacter sp.]